MENNAEILVTFLVENRRVRSVIITTRPLAQYFGAKRFTILVFYYVFIYIFIKVKIEDNLEILDLFCISFFLY